MFKSKSTVSLTIEVLSSLNLNQYFSISFFTISFISFLVGALSIQMGFHLLTQPDFQVVVKIRISQFNHSTHDVLFLDFFSISIQNLFFSQYRIQSNIQ